MLIFGQKIKLRKEKDLGRTRGLAGYFDPMNKEIVIDADLKGRDLLQTLIHEVNHAVAHRVGLVQTRISHDAHEFIAENMATAWIELLTDKEVASITRRLFKLG